MLSLLLNFGIRALDNQVRNGGSNLHRVTNLVGTSVSGFFLYVIAALNVVILVGIVRVFREMRSGRFSEGELDAQLDKRGLINRILGPLARKIDAPWKIYPIGVLFGLGFDTATEVALLVLAGTAVASGLPFYAILSLPILFAAGMCLFDTADGCFMNFAYDWAFSRPVRKVYYNITITGLRSSSPSSSAPSSCSACSARSSNFPARSGPLCRPLTSTRPADVIVAVFVVVWVIALAIWKYGKIEQKWDLAAAQAQATD